MKTIALTLLATVALTVSVSADDVVIRETGCRVEAALQPAGENPMVEDIRIEEEEQVSLPENRLMTPVDALPESIKGILIRVMGLLIS